LFELGTGGTVIPEPADQQCGIFNAAFRHGVSNKTWEPYCDRRSGRRNSINQESSWLKLDAEQVPSCDGVKCEKSRRIYDLNAVSIISLKSSLSCPESQ
ncbi:hypothetical protein T4A_8349, partial [Trichinella pseudospiralis]